MALLTLYLCLLLLTLLKRKPGFKKVAEIKLNR